VNGSPARLLIMGASGLLGRVVAREALTRPGFEVCLAAFRREPRQTANSATYRVDLRNGKFAVALLEEADPDIVINCAGLVKSLCNTGYEAVRLNSALPHLVAEYLRKHDGKLVQVSTDCVFSGRKGRYSERDLPDPVDLYGRTKLAGEVYDWPHLTVRTSFVGLEPPPARGLLGWFLSQTGSVEGYKNSLWSGLTTPLLAKILLDLAESDVGGLLHIAGETVDKATLLTTAAEIFRKDDVDVHPVESPACDRSLVSIRPEAKELGIPRLRPMLEGLAADAGTVVDKNGGAKA